MTNQKTNCKKISKFASHPVIAALILVLFFWLLGIFSLPGKVEKLEKTLEIVSQKYSDLESKYNFIAGVIAAKTGVSIPALQNAIQKKGLDSAATHKAIEVISTQSRAKAQMYLRNKLNFEPAELKAIFPNDNSIHKAKEKKKQ